MRKHPNRFGRLLGSLAISGLFAMGTGLANVGTANAKPSPQIQWVNYMDLVPGDPSDTTAVTLEHPSFGTNTLGLVITSSSLGDTDSNNENKVVTMALELPKQVKVTGVRICYENSDPGTSGTFIEQTRLAQLNNTDGSTASVLLDDATHLDATGPTCATSALASPAIKGSAGSVILSFRVNTANVNDQIVIHSVGLLVK
jgi:hypothetical protein